jgi:hypothetical protein
LIIHGEVPDVLRLVVKGAGMRVREPVLGAELVTTFAGKAYQTRLLFALVASHVDIFVLYIIIVI